MNAIYISAAAVCMAAAIIAEAINKSNEKKTEREMRRRELFNHMVSITNLKEV